MDPSASQLRTRALAGAVIGFAISATLILAASRGDPDRMTIGDGLIYQYIAANLAADPHEVHEVVAERGSSVRYGRIGLPVAIWIASAGRPQAMALAQPVVMALCGAAAGAAAALLFFGAGPPAALLPFLAPGFTLSVSGGYAEALAVAAALWAVWFGVRARWWPAAGMLAVALLAKENAGAVLLGLAIFALWWRRRARDAAVLASSIVPIGAWYLVVRERFGHFPVLDPYLRETTETIGTPVVSLVRSFIDPASVPSLVAAALHVAAAVLVLLIARKSIFGLVGAAASLQLLSAAPFAWEYVGDATRISSFIEVFAVLAVTAKIRPGWASAGTLRDG